MSVVRQRIVLGDDAAMRADDLVGVRPAEGAEVVDAGVFVGERLAHIRQILKGF